MSFDPASTWIGVGQKTGFSLGPGYEQFVGAIWNCNDFRYAGLRINSFRIGVGVGGSTGVSLVLIFNALNQARIHNLEVSDWGINLAIGDRLGSIVSALRSPRAWASFIRVLRTVNQSRVGRGLSSAGIRAVSGSDLDSLRNLASTSWSALDVEEARRTNEVKVIVLDMPFAGLGAEISFNWVVGRAEIYY